MVALSLLEIILLIYMGVLFIKDKQGRSTKTNYWTIWIVLFLQLVANILYK